MKKKYPEILGFNMKLYITKIFILCSLGVFSGIYGKNTGIFYAKNFDYLLGKTPGIDKNLLEMHFKLYQGYVNNTNSLALELQNLEAAGKSRSFEYGALKRRFGWEYDGMILHELYFSNMGYTTKLSSRDLLYQHIVRDFGSFDAWLSDFKATGLIRGIGWVVLYKDPIEGRLFNVWINEHPTNHLAGGEPILVLDVWEHAYLTQYGLDRAAYIDAFIKNINWDVVSRRYSSSRSSYRTVSR